MSREAYQAPTIPNGATQFSTGQEGSSSDPVVMYLCGDCNSRVPMKRTDPIRCKECGHRVLYKERTNRYVFQGIRWTIADNTRMVQFQAR